MTQQRDPETSPTVVRSTELDMGVDELWRLISTAEGWAGWLVDDAEIDVMAGASGSASDAGIRRDIRIDHVNEGRRVDFVWWERDEPSSKSYVQLEIVELPTGGSRLNVSEQLVSTHATLSSSVDAWWQVRFVSLWLLALHSTVMA
jgi:hypothetical protein